MKRIVLFLSLILVLALPAAAQDAADEQHPLLALLALVPDAPTIFEQLPSLGYVDYVALDAARPGIPDFASAAEYTAAREASEPGPRVWMANTSRMITGVDEIFQATLYGGAETRELAGFDAFEIDRAVIFGAPPATVRILQGDFDAQAIVAAHEARGFAARTEGDLTLLARADGAPGTTMSLETRNPANPFGGQLGRMEPLILADDLIVNSASDEAIQTLLGMLTQERRSLLARPSIRAAAEALTDAEPVLLQASFLDPRHVAIAPTGSAMIGAMLAGTRTPEELERLMGPLIPDYYGTLPFYTMAVMADRELDGEQMATIALVYDGEATAQAAAEEMTARLALFRDTIQRRHETPFMDEIEGARVDEPQVYHSESTGKYVALASVLYPTPDNTLVHMLTGEPAEEGDVGATYTSSGLLVRYWISALYARAFDVLYVNE